MKTGKVSESVLKRSIIRQIKNKRQEIISGAVVGGDCAIFSLSELEEAGNLVTCMQESAIWTDEIPDVWPPVTIEHLITVCVNNLAVGGAEPFAILLTLLLPPEFEEPGLKNLMNQAETVCKRYGMQIAGGQTQVTQAVNGPIAVVTGYGIRKSQVSDKTSQAMEGSAKTGKSFKMIGKATPGQAVIITKWVGLQGTSYLAKKYKEALCQRYPAYYIEEAASFEKYMTAVPEAAVAVKSGVGAMHDISKGGVFGALWELAESAGVGLDIDLKKIPLRQETVEVCEFCNRNPYELMSAGSLLLTATDGEKMIHALQEAGIEATIVGSVTDSKDRILRNEDEIRYMDRPCVDAIYEEN